MNVIINPGTGAVPGATRRQADINMRALRKDLGLDGVRFARFGRIENGRYDYRMWRGTKQCIVAMPGIALDQVRWMRLDHQVAWDFPRLYVDGSSWLWYYAVSCAKERLA